MSVLDAVRRGGRASAARPDAPSNGLSLVTLLIILIAASV